MAKYWLITTTLAVIFGMGRADTGYFWHISDLHYDPTYGKEMRSCNEKIAVPGYYGNEWCDSSWGLISDGIANMVKIKSDVDFILWTGDSIPHIDDAYMDQTYILNIMRNITDALMSAFPNTAVYPTMGNNDWYPSDQFTPTPHPIYNYTAEMWRTWIWEDAQVDNFRKGAYYTRKTRYGLRIVGLNTNVYYFRDKLTVNVSDPVGQFKWLDGVLKDARTAGEKVLLTSHVPPGIQAVTQWQWYNDPFNNRFLDITGRYSDIIVGMFSGHDHGDVLKLQLLNKDKPGMPIYIAPCLTPWRFKIPSRSGSPHHPAIRLIKYERDSSLPLEIQQYYLDIAQANKLNISKWKMAYSTSQAYGMADLSASSLQKLMKKMERDEAMLNKYIRHHTVLANGETDVKTCDRECRARFICSLTKLKKPEFESCVTSRVSSASSVSLVPFLIVATISISLILTL